MVQHSLAGARASVGAWNPFESGRAPFDWARIRAFAAATDSDPHAILAAVLIGSPQFAVRCMDNKLARVLSAAVRHADARMGDRLARLEVSRLIAAFGQMFATLERDLAAREAEAADWLGDTSPPTPKGSD